MWHKFVLLLAFGCFGLIRAGEKVGIGPFKGFLVKVGKCEKTTYQMYGNSPMILYLELYNTSTQYFLLRGNLTVIKPIKDVKVQVKNYIWENNKWSLFYMINNMGCHRLAQLVFATFSIKFDFKTCTFLKGPYKMFIDKVAVCKTLSHPAIKNPSVIVNVESYNTTSKHFLIRGNFTVIRDTRNIVLRSKTFTWENGKWKIIYLMSNMACHGIFLPAALKFMGIQFNAKECLFPKSFNHFENINLNDLGHMVTGVAEYGRMMYRADMLTRAMQTIYCWEFEGQVVPDQ